MDSKLMDRFMRINKELNTEKLRIEVMKKIEGIMSSTEPSDEQKENIFKEALYAGSNIYDNE
jgi:hypothetical protein